jgi:hypothetical protein
LLPLIAFEFEVRNDIVYLLGICKCKQNLSSLFNKILQKLWFCLKEEVT